MGPQSSEDLVQMICGKDRIFFSPSLCRNNDSYLRVNLERNEDLEFVGVMEASLMLVEILFIMPGLVGSGYGA